MTNEEDFGPEPGDHGFILNGGLKPDLAAGDHFAGMPEPQPDHCAICCGQTNADGHVYPRVDHEAVSIFAENCEEEHLGAGGFAVIAAISDEIDRGDAHLMTRNELAEFVRWLVTSEEATDDLGGNINETIYQYMNFGEWTDESQRFADVAAKKFFVEKGYEPPIDADRQLEDQFEARFEHGAG